MREFRDAVEAMDDAAVERLLADAVVLHSPVAIGPYEGKPVVAAILRAARRVMGSEFRYERVFSSTDGRDHTLVFRTTLRGKAVQGCDILHLDETGLIDEFTVMVRPMSGVQALNEAMGAQFAQIVREAETAARPE